MLSEGIPLSFPLFELASGRVTGFEALARWNHPELGAISPATFVAIAEGGRFRHRLRVVAPPVEAPGEQP